MKRIPGVIIALSVLVIVFASSVGSTLAAWTARGDTVNKITVGSIKGQIKEDYAQGQTVMPGTTVKKVVNVTNTGNIDMLIRVKITKAWGSSRDADGNLIVNPWLSTDNILITFNTTDWYHDTSDDYYYYIGAVSPGETTKVPLMKEFTVSSNSGSIYAGDTADITVYLECVQAAGNGIKAWSKNPFILGDYKPGTVKTDISEVVFLNPADGFSFKTVGGDLFVNFKDMVPGESRSQTVRISSEYPGRAEIFLKADYMDQTQATAENRELIDKLLKQYATITLTADDGTLLYRGPVWGNPDVDSHGTDSEKYFISLGNFDAGTGKNVTVMLSLDPAMDNKYQKLLGQVKWTFAAEGRSDVYSATKTGEDTQLLVSLTAVLLSASAIYILVKVTKRRIKADSPADKT